MTTTPNFKDRHAARVEANSQPGVDPLEAALVEEYNIHHAESIAANFRAAHRIQRYNEEPLLSTMNHLTDALAGPGKLSAWRRIIMFGGENGKPGLDNSTEYQAFCKDAFARLRTLGEEWDGFRANLQSALGPQEMTEFLRDRISSTEPAPQRTLHQLLAEHIGPHDLQAREDADLARQFRSKKMRNEGFIKLGP